MYSSTSEEVQQYVSTTLGWKGTSGGRFSSMDDVPNTGKWSGGVVLQYNGAFYAFAEGYPFAEGKLKTTPYLHKNGKTYLCWANPDGSAGKYVHEWPESSGSPPDGYVKVVDEGTYYFVLSQPTAQQ